MHLAGDSTPQCRSNIAATIAEIAKSPFNTHQHIIDADVIPSLVKMANQDDSTPEVRSRIASAFQNIATSNIGREALIDNSTSSFIGAKWPSKLIIHLKGESISQLQFKILQLVMSEGRP